jgi:hypothetical protein
MPRLKKKWMLHNTPAAPVLPLDPVAGCPEFPDIQTAIQCLGFSEGQLRGMIKRGEIRAAKMPYKREGKLHVFREDLKKLMEEKAREFAAKAA